MEAARPVYGRSLLEAGEVVALSGTNSSEYSEASATVGELRSYSAYTETRIKEVYETLVPSSLHALLVNKGRSE